MQTKTKKYVLTITSFSITGQWSCVRLCLGFDKACLPELTCLHACSAATHIPCGSLTYRIGYLHCSFVFSLCQQFSENFTLQKPSFVKSRLFFSCLHFIIGFLPNYCPAIFKFSCNFNRNVRRCFTVAGNDNYILDKLPSFCWKCPSPSFDILLRKCLPNKNCF